MSAIDITGVESLSSITITTSIAINITSPIAVNIITPATTPIEMQRFRGCDRRASTRMSNRILHQRLHLRGDMGHCRLSDKFDSDLHSNGKPLVHLACDVLDGSLCNVGQGLFHDSITGEDVEIRLGYDLKFHPRNFTEHDGKLLVELNDDDNTICIAKSDSEIEASDVIIFAFAVTVFNNQKEAVERTLEAILAETL